MRINIEINSYLQRQSQRHTQAKLPNISFLNFWTEYFKRKFLIRTQKNNNFTRWRDKNDLRTENSLEKCYGFVWWLKLLYMKSPLRKTMCVIMFLFFPLFAYILTDRLQILKKGKLHSSSEYLENLKNFILFKKFLIMTSKQFLVFQCLFTSASNKWWNVRILNEWKFNRQSKALMTFFVFLFLWCPQTEVNK